VEKDPEGIFMRNICIRQLAITLFLFLSLFLNPYPVSPSETVDKESELNWVLKNVKQAELKLNTFAAKMVQIRETQLLKSPLRSEGFIYFDHKGKMLFKVTNPSPLMVLFKEDMVLIYYPDISKMEERYVGQSILREYFGIGASIEELRKQYSIQLISKPPREGYHLRIHFREKDGDWISIRLEFTSINEPLPQNVFKMRLPEEFEGDPYPD
jgi:outer membrane lipoprotein-sorting protein